jgi:hypothetical protein
MRDESGNSSINSRNARSAPGATSAHEEISKRAASGDTIHPGICTRPPPSLMTVKIDESRVFQ